MRVEELTMIYHALVCVFGAKQSLKIFKKLTKMLKKISV